MRIIAGAWRGRVLRAPPGETTRPTSDRARQALFDILTHAPWGGRSLFDGATVLDAFAGTGALGLEALSRGAAGAVFIERHGAALAVLRANIAACGAEGRCTVIAGDATNPPRGSPCRLAFLDPPYRFGLVDRTILALAAAGWIDGATMMVAETARDEAVPTAGTLLADRAHGAARMTVWRNPPIERSTA